MNVFMTPKQAAAVLQCDEKTVRKRIKRGTIKNVITNGESKSGVRYLIDMTREYGIERDDSLRGCAL